MKIWCSLNRSRITLGRSWDLSRHQKTSKEWQNIHLGASGKMFKSWPKTSSFEGFWDLIFSNFPCWRMCCLAAGLEGTFTWLLEEILAQSNYRTCWIFGSTSVQILGPFSILFGEYLEIYPLDLDDFQKLWGYLITLEACSLRLDTALLT